jgi:hypothetical protein
MFMKRSDYEVTENFIGLIWKGRAIVGADVAGWAWGIVFVRWYAGWYIE